MALKQLSIKENSSSQNVKSVPIRNWYIALCTLFLLVFATGAGIMGCKSEITQMKFAQLNVFNLASTNLSDVLTNVDIVDYRTNMATTLQNLTSSSATSKEQAYYDFTTNTNMFSWTSSSSLIIEYGESESIFHSACGVDKVVKVVKNNNFSGANLSRKFYYGIIRPMSCGYSYTISITN